MGGEGVFGVARAYLVAALVVLMTALWVVFLVFMVGLRWLIAIPCGFLIAFLLVFHAWLIETIKKIGYAIKISTDAANQ